jgi:excisionase family DNA binding protein
MKPNEIAALLRVSNEAAGKEISSGKLPAPRSGSKRLILHKDFEQFLPIQGPRAKGETPNDVQVSVVFSAAKPFDHQWPQKKDHPRAPEHFDTAYTSTVVTSYGSKTVLIGFSDSKRTGHRRRSVVFIDGQPMVRFRAADDFDRSGLMVSVIKTGDRKYLRAKDSIPIEYSNFRIEPYRKHVHEAHISQNAAVVCAKDDLQTMAAHALVTANQDRVDTSFDCGWRELL